MRRCKHVEFCDGLFHHDLERLDEGRYKLKEIFGRIDFCESKQEGLVIKLSNHLHPEKTNGITAIWRFDKEIPLPAVCGHGLRCFYEETYKQEDIEKIKIDAYELLDNPNSSFVMGRATKNNGYKFVDN